MRPESAPETPRNPPQQVPPHSETELTASDKKRPEWLPPRGIRYVLREDRPNKPFQLIWSEQGKEKKKAYSSKKDRELMAKSLAEKRSKHGSSILTFDPARWRIFELFTEMVGADVDPLQVAREWKAARGAGANAALNLTVSEAVENYLALRKQEGGVDPGYLSHVTLHLRTSFAGAYGHVPLSEVTKEMVREWLGNLRGRARKGNEGKLGIESRQHYYRSLNTFFARAKLEDWVVHNVCEKVMRPEPTPAELEALDKVKLMPVADVEKLFQANRNYRVVGRLALEAFGGVRFTTAGKLTVESLNFAERGLALPGAIQKGRKRKYRQGHPPCLWAWLEHVRDNLADCWTMTPKQYLLEKHDAFVRAGVTLPHNGLRHSFASYLAARDQDLRTTGYLMQHKSISMTEKYEGRATTADGVRYFNILP